MTNQRLTQNSTFAKQGEARAWIAKMTADRKAGRQIGGSTKMTVGEYLDKWIAEGFANLAVSTQRSYEEIARLYLRPHLAAVPLTAVTTLGVQDVVGRLVESGLSPTTVRHAATVLRIALGQAVEWGLLSASPAASGIKLPKKVESEANKAMTSEEAARFEVALDGERHRALFLTLIRTGIRPGESFGLRWSDLDLGDRPTLSVNRAVQRSGAGEVIFDEPKTKRSRRTIRLDADVASTLLDARDASQSAAVDAGKVWSEDGLVFPSKTGTPLDRHSTRRAFKRIAKKARLGRMVPTGAKRGPQERFDWDHSLYGLRHTAATLALAAGVHVQVVSANLGHKSTAFTMDVYCRDLLPEMQDDAVEKMAAFRAAVAA